MAHVIEEYTNNAGTKFFLQEFDSTRIYHPQDSRQIQRDNASFYQAKQADSQTAIKASEQAAAKASAALSDDDYYELKLKEDKRKKLEQLLSEQQEAEALKQKELLLKDATQPFVQLCSTNPIVFLNEFAVRSKQGYVLDESTLNFTPYLCAASMIKKIKQ